MSYFDSVSLALLPLIIILKNNNFTTTPPLAKNNYFPRKFTECSNNSRDTWKALNGLIRCKNTSKDVILNHNGSSVSGPAVSA